MKKLALLLIVSFGMMSTVEAKEGINFESLSLKEALAKAKAENKIVFIDIYATWCGPCKMLSRDVFVDENLGQFMNEHFVNVKLDGEKEDGERLMIDFDLNSYPTMLFISPDMENLNKIVGFVDAEKIEAEARAVIFPESTEIFKLTARFDKGERGKEFLQEFINLSIDEEKPTEAAIAEYLKLFPEFDLEKEGEFIVFAVAIEDLDDPTMKEFLKNAEKYREIHGHLTKWKISKVLMKSLEVAVETENIDLIRKDAKTVLAAYQAIFQEESTDLDELVEALEDMYHDRV